MFMSVKKIRWIVLIAVGLVVGRYTIDFFVTIHKYAYSIELAVDDPAFWMFKNEALKDIAPNASRYTRKSDVVHHFFYKEVCMIDIWEMKGLTQKSFKDVCFTNNINLAADVEIKPRETLHKGRSPEKTMYMGPFFTKGIFAVGWRYMPCYIRVLN